MKVLGNIRIIFIFSFLIFCSCENQSSSNQAAEILTVSAAISLKEAFDEIGKEFQAKSGKKINFNYGASGALQTQIENGAPVDVFASAGEKQMDELEAKNLIDNTSRKDFARNSLVLIAPKNHGDTLSGFEILARPEIKKIAVGNPKTVPAGLYADEVFERLNLKKDLQNKLIFAENVRQVLDYVARSEVDLGIVYKTDAGAADDKVDVVTTVPENSHSPILYPIALIKDGDQKQNAKEFLDFVLSAQGQQILRKYGFKGASEK